MTNEILIAIHNWLKAVDATEKNDFGAKAGGFLKYLSSSNTFFLIEARKMVFHHCRRWKL